MPGAWIVVNQGANQSETAAVGYTIGMTVALTLGVILAIVWLCRKWYREHFDIKRRYPWPCLKCAGDLRKNGYILNEGALFAKGTCKRCGVGWSLSLNPTGGVTVGHW